MEPQARGHWDQRAREGAFDHVYDEGGPAEHHAFHARRDGMARVLTGRRFEYALDLGCGSGGLAGLVDGFAQRYVGLDASREMVRRAAAKHGGPGRSFLVGDGERMPLRDGSVDLVVAIGYLAFFREPALALEEIRRVLRPGGTLVLQAHRVPPRASLPTSESAAAHPPGWIDRPYEPEELETMLALHGLAQRGIDRHDYRALPGRIRVAWPHANAWLSETIRRLAPHALRALARSYVVRCERVP